MSKERTKSVTEQTKVAGRETFAAEPGGESSYHTERSTQRSKLSVNVGRDISERLRSLAYTHRLSESSIVEVALTMFFTRGDDAMLGVMLKELGATLRRK